MVDGACEITCSRKYTGTIIAVVLRVLRRMKTATSIYARRRRSLVGELSLVGSLLLNFGCEPQPATQAETTKQTAGRTLFSLTGAPDLTASNSPAPQSEQEMDALARRRFGAPSRALSRAFRRNLTHDKGSPRYLIIDLENWFPKDFEKQLSEQYTLGGAIGDRLSGGGRSDSEWEIDIQQKRWYPQPQGRVINSFQLLKHWIKMTYDHAWKNRGRWLETSRSQNDGLRAQAVTLINQFEPHTDHDADARVLFATIAFSVSKNAKGTYLYNRKVATTWNLSGEIPDDFYEKAPRAHAERRQLLIALGGETHSAQRYSVSEDPALQECIDWKECPRFLYRTFIPWRTCQTTPSTPPASSSTSPAD